MKFQVRATALLAVMVASVLLSGCLVQKDKKPAKTYQSSTNTLHTYVSGNVITYDLTKYSDPPEFGTLEVKWEQAALLQDPFSTTTSYSVLKETTSIYSNGNTSPDESTVRYIEQGSTGSLFLRAIHDITSQLPTDNYWLSDQATVPSGTLDRVEILHSPFTLGDSLQIDFDVMEGCSGSSCLQSLGHFSNHLDTADTAVVSGTRYGTFSNAYLVSYQGLVTTTAFPLPFFDFVDICHTTGSASTLHSGSFYIFPEVGVIKIENSCTSGTNQVVNYTATLRNTNIPLPPPTN